MYSHTISAEQLLPVMFSLPTNDSPPSLPFQFTGGFAMSTKTIGKILSLQGLIQVVATLLVFPYLQRRLGNIVLFRIAAFSYPWLYIAMPYITLISGPLRMPCVYLILVWKVSAQSFTMTPATIMLGNNSPSGRAYGRLFGVMGSAASLCRTFGPTISGILQARGLAIGSLGLPWWAMAGMAVLGAVLSLYMTDDKHLESATEKAAAAEDALDEPLLPIEIPRASLEAMQSLPSSPILARCDRRSSLA
jgi:hypothetical protein